MTYYLLGWSQDNKVYIICETEDYNHALQRRSMETVSDDANDWKKLVIVKEVTHGPTSDVCAV